MIDFKKAMKLYIRTSFKPITLFFGLGTPIAFLSGLMVDPSKQGDKDYGDMIASMGMIHAMLLFIFFVGNITISQAKFFGSLPHAKKILTDVPIVAMGIVCLIFDISTFTAAFFVCGKETAADLLIVNSVNTVIACFINASMCKCKGKLYTILSASLFVLFMNQVVILSRFNLIRNGFGVKIHFAALIALSVYIIGFSAVHLFMQWWWNNSGRNYNNSNNAIAQNMVARDS